MPVRAGAGGGSNGHGDHADAGAGHGGGEVAHGDGLHTRVEPLEWQGGDDGAVGNYRVVWELVRRSGGALAITDRPLGCYDLDRYGAVLAVDPEHAWARGEVDAVVTRVAAGQLSLLVMGDWSDEAVQRLRFRDDSTRTRWSPAVGGVDANVVNALTRPLGVVCSGAVSGAAHLHAPRAAAQRGPGGGLAGLATERDGDLHAKGDAPIWGGGVLGLTDAAQGQAGEWWRAVGTVAAHAPPGAAGHLGAARRGGDPTDAVVGLARRFPLQPAAASPGTRPASALLVVGDSSCGDVSLPMSPAAARVCRGWWEQALAFLRSPDAFPPPVGFHPVPAGTLPAPVASPHPSPLTREHSGAAPPKAVDPSGAAPALLFRVGVEEDVFPQSAAALLADRATAPGPAPALQAGGGALAAPDPAAGRGGAGGWLARVVDRLRSTLRWRWGGAAADDGGGTAAGSDAVLGGADAWRAQPANALPEGVTGSEAERLCSD